MDKEKMKKLFLLFIIYTINISAFWDTYDFQNKDTLNDNGYIALKKQMLEYFNKGWCSQEKLTLLMDLTLLTEPKACAEIGVFYGNSAIPVAAILEYNNKGIIYAIDAWSNEEAIKNFNEEGPNRVWWATVDLLQCKERFQEIIKTWHLEKKIIIKHATAKQAASEIPTLDFLHLDGNFSDDSAYEDLLLYLPKVKKGGYILLSNILFLGKKKAFLKLYESCEWICELDNGDTVLFKK